MDLDSNVYEDIKSSLIDGRASLVKLLTEQALRLGHSPEEIVDKGLLEGMNVVGSRFRNGSMAIPDVLLSSRAMHAGLYVVKPLLAQNHPSREGRIVIGTVAGDLHDIGKRLVAIIMESKGLDVVDIGIDVPPEAFVQSVAQLKPRVLAMSALLTTTMLSMKQTIRALEKAGLRSSVKVVVGGGPVTREFAEDIGADGYGHDATSGAALCAGWITD